MECEHKYVFLREESRNIGSDHAPRMLYADIFFCERCLAYARIETRIEERRIDSFDFEVTKRYMFSC